MDCISVIYTIFLTSICEKKTQFFFFKFSDLFSFDINSNYILIFCRVTVLMDINLLFELCFAGTLDTVLINHRGIVFINFNFVLSFFAA
jgi:hypothetical protein